MAAIPQISQNLFYMIIAILIVVIGLIIAFLLSRRGRRRRKSIKFIAKETELKKIKIVERDLELKPKTNILYEDTQEEKLTRIRDRTSDLTHKSGYFDNEINERANGLETQTKHLNIRKRLNNIEKKEHELGRPAKD